MNEKKEYKKLMKNTVIFAFGTFGSKVLTFLIVPLYTYILSTEDYGNVDLFSTAISLMLPFTTLVIYEGIIRFLTTKKITRKTAITICLIVFLFGTLLSLIGMPIFYYIFRNTEYTICYALCLVVSTYNQIFSQFLRADNKSVAFSVNGVLVTCVTVLANLIFLIVLKLGVIGYIYSLILAQVVASIQATVAGKIYYNISFRSVKFNQIVDIIKYCFPLIPNNLMLWVMNAGDKYIINYYMGSEANGIYALAMKVPTILHLLFSIFMQAWQLSAIDADDKSGQAKFYSDIFITMAGLLSIASSICTIIVKPLFIFIMEPSFAEAWRYIPLLNIAILISCFSTFTGVIYMVKMNSIKAFYSTALGAIVNIIMNFVFIRTLGLYGVALGTGIGYLTVFIFRARDAKRMTGMSFNVFKNVFSIVILLFQAIVLIYINEKYVWGIEVICLFIILLIYRKYIINFFVTLKGRKK